MQTPRSSKVAGERETVGLPPGPWRVGASWSHKGGLTTVVAEGTGPADERGRREDDVPVGTMATPELAALVVRAVNELGGHDG